MGQNSEGKVAPNSKEEVELKAGAGVGAGAGQQRRQREESEAGWRGIARKPALWGKRGVCSCPRTGPWPRAVLCSWRRPLRLMTGTRGPAPRPVAGRQGGQRGWGASPPARASQPVLGEGLAGSQAALLSLSRQEGSTRGVAHVTDPRAWQCCLLAPGVGGHPRGLTRGPWAGWELREGLAWAKASLASGQDQGGAAAGSPPPLGLG